jgi:hypothetical protein
MSKHIFLMSCLNRFRSIFPKKYNFYDTLWHYFAGENLINRQINGDLEPLKGFGIIFFVHITSDIFKLILEND